MRPDPLPNRRGPRVDGAMVGAHREVTGDESFASPRPTGDRNPPHYDAELCACFGSIVVQGGVTTGLLNAVVAEDLPGPGSAFLHTEWSYQQPVHPGNTITATQTVLERRDDKPITRLATTIVNQHGTVVVVGTALVWSEPLHGGSASPPTVEAWYVSTEAQRFAAPSRIRRPTIDGRLSVDRRLSSYQSAISSSGSPRRIWLLRPPRSLLTSPGWPMIDGN